MLLGYLPTSDAFESAVVLTNPGVTPILADLTFYNGAGEIVHSMQQELQPGRPNPILVGQLIPEQSQGDLALVAETQDGNLAGVVFVFNTSYYEPAMGNATAL